MALSDAMKTKFYIDTKNAIKNVKGLNLEVNNLGKNIMAAFQTSAVIGWAAAIKSVTDQMIEASKAQAEYIESLNLLEVAYRSDTEEGKKFLENAENLVNTLKNFYGLDPSGLTRQLGIYKQMTSAMQLGEQASTSISESLLKMQEDVSSLYNMDFERVGSKFQSALAGQTRAVRDLGVDITQTTLQQTLYSLGIDKSISEMNRATKTALIYISMYKQLQNAQGDAGRTINSVANQTRIFREQISIAARQLGGLFIPVLKTILPLLNGILMALNAIGEFLLGLLGVAPKDLASEFGIKTVSNGLADIGMNAEEASKSVDKLYGKLRPFDKLNVITTPKDKGDDASKYGGGIDAGVADALKGMNYELGEVNNKAKEIRDHILGWLGFTVDENGQIKEFHITLGTIAGILMVGGIIYKGVKGIFGIFSGLGAMLGMGGSVGKGIKGISSALKGTGGISDSANALKVPKATTIIKGLADLALIVGGLMVLTAAIGEVMKDQYTKEVMGSGLNAIKELFVGLGTVAIQIGVFSGIIVGLGFANPATVLSGLLGFGAIVIGLEAVLAALGSMVENPKIAELATKGQEVLFGLAETIGGFGGKIISSFSDKATEGLGAIGTHLTEFMTNSKYFFDNISQINSSTLEGAKAIAGAMLEFTAASLLNGIGEFFSFFTGKRMTFEDFGKELENFAPHFVNYYKSIKEVNGDVVEKSANAAKSLAEMAQKIPRQDGALQWLLGEKNLAKFGETLVPFGKSFKQYYLEIKEVNGEVVEKSANAAMSLAELANKIPLQGGALQWLLGEKNLQKFGDTLVPFGEAFAKYDEKIRNIDGDVVVKSANAAQSLAELANKVPKQDGVLQWLLGEQNLGKFGQELETFGAYFSSYYWKMNGVDTGKIDSVTNSIHKIIEMAKDIKDNNLGDAWKNFGKSLDNSSTGINNFFNRTNADNIGYDFGQKIAAAMTRGLKNYNFPSLQIKDGWNVIGSYKVQMKAEGGFVDSGDLFLSRENGIPEMVGRIGNKTAVANNDQIVSSISIGVERAMSKAKSNQTVQIVAEDGGILDAINFKQKHFERQYGL